VKARLDHIGIAVSDVGQALAFYRDALGLEVEAPEEVASQKVRAYFIPVGEATLELLEATSPESPIAKYVARVSTTSRCGSRTSTRHWPN